MKEYIRKIISLLGYEIRKKKTNFFSKNKIDLIIDVGAHRGEFALEVLNESFKGKIISFEPQLEIYNILLNNSEKYDNWTVYKRCGIGKKKSIINNEYNE